MQDFHHLLLINYSVHVDYGILTRWDSCMLYHILLQSIYKVYLYLNLFGKL